MSNYVHKDELKNLTVDKYRENAPEESQESIRSGLKRNEEHRVKLTKHILTYAKKDVWTEEMLKEQSISMLETLAESYVAPINYAGQGAGGTTIATQAGSNGIKPMLPGSITANLKKEDK